MPSSFVFLSLVEIEKVELRYQPPLFILLSLFANGANRLLVDQVRWCCRRVLASSLVQCFIFFVDGRRAVSLNRLPVACPF